MTSPDDFHTLPHDMTPMLGTTVVGVNWQHVTATGSTNDDLKLLARDGAPEGTVLSTDEQLSGRGRRGRSWNAPAASSLLLSTLLRPTWLPAPQGGLLTMLAAVACAEAIEAATPLQVALKWPNDLLVDGRKVGGILLETELAQSGFAWAIVGTGINITWEPSTDPALGTSATSLSSALGHAVERAPILFALLRHLDARYARLKAGAHTELFQHWRARLDTLGQRVAVEESGHIEYGIAEDVTPEGALVVRSDDGTTRTVSAGDVSVRLANG